MMATGCQQSAGQCLCIPEAFVRLYIGERIDSVRFYCDYLMAQL